jgi:hypothetical protein
MQNDSIETLLLRHYGSSAAAPDQLEQRLLTSLHRETQHRQQQQRVYERRLNRRQVVRLVAISSAGIGLLSAGLEGLQQLEATLVGQDTSQPTFS